MPFEKQLLELQEMIRKFLEIHANPYDTSKHNKTAEKLEKVQKALAQVKIVNNEEITATLLLKPPLIESYNALAKLNEFIINYTVILDNFERLIKSEEHRDLLMFHYEGVKSLKEQDISEYIKEYDAYLLLSEEEKAKINLHKTHVDLEWLYQKLKKYPNVLNDIEQLKDIFISYNEIDVLIDSFTQYRDSNLLQDEINAHIESGITFTEERMQLLKSCIEKCETLLDIYNVANFYVQEKFKNIIEKQVIPERDMLVNETLPAAEIALKESVEAQSDLKDEFYLHKLDRIEKNPELPDNGVGTYQETPYKDLFVQGGMDSNDISIDDIKQGDSMGDCFFLSALGSLANANPSAIKNMITDNKNGTYTVKLYLKQLDGSRLPQDITVTDEMLYDSNGKLITAQEGDGELWVMVIEKAYAKALGGYDNIDEGGRAKEAMAVLTNKVPITTKILPPIPTTFWTNLSAALSASKAITLGTKRHSAMNRARVIKDIPHPADPTKNIGVEEVGGMKIFASHLYMVVAVNAVAQTIDLRNPHGANHIKGLSTTQLEDYFEDCQEC